MNFTETNPDSRVLSPTEALHPPAAPQEKYCPPQGIGQPDQLLALLQVNHLLGDDFDFAPQNAEDLTSMLCPTAVTEVLDLPIELATQGSDPIRITVTLRQLMNQELDNVRAGHWQLEGGIVRSLLTTGMLIKALQPWVSEEELTTLLNKPRELLNDIDLCGTPHTGIELGLLKTDLISLAGRLFNLEPNEAKKTAFPEYAQPKVIANLFLTAKLGSAGSTLLEFKLSFQHGYLFTIDQLVLSLEAGSYKLKSKGPKPMLALIDYYCRLIRAPYPKTINRNGFPRLISWMTKGFRSVDPLLATILWDTFHPYHSSPEARGTKFASSLRSHHSDDAGVHVSYYLQACQLLSELNVPSTDIENLWPVASFPDASSEGGAALQQLGQRLQAHPEQLPCALALLQLVAQHLYLEPDEKSGIRITKSTAHQGKEYWELHFNTPEPCAIFLPACPADTLAFLNAQMEKGTFDPFEWGDLGQIIIATREALVWQWVIHSEPSPAKTSWAWSFLNTLLQRRPDEFFTYLEQARCSGLLSHSPRESAMLFNSICAHLAASQEHDEARCGKLATLEKLRQAIPLTTKTRSSTAWLIDQLYHHGEKNSAMRLLQQADDAGLFREPTRAATCVHGVLLEAIKEDTNTTEAAKTLLAEQDTLASHPQYADVWMDVLTRLLKKHPKKGRRLLCQTPESIRTDETLLALALDKDAPAIENYETKTLYKTLVAVGKPLLWIRFANLLKCRDERQVKQLWQVILTHIPAHSASLSLSELLALTLHTLQQTEDKKVKLGAEGKRLGETYICTLTKKLLDAEQWQEAKQLLTKSTRCELCKLPSTVFEESYIKIAAAERKLSPDSAREFANQHLLHAVQHHRVSYRQLLLDLTSDAIKAALPGAADDLLHELGGLINEETRHTIQSLHTQLARMRLQRNAFAEVANAMISSSSSDNYLPETREVLLFEALTLWCSTQRDRSDLADFILKLPTPLPPSKEWQQLLLAVTQKLVKSPHVQKTWNMLQRLEAPLRIPFAEPLIKKAIAKKEFSLGWAIATCFPQDNNLEQMMITASVQKGHHECIAALVRHTQKDLAPPSEDLVAGCLKHIQSIRKHKTEHKKMLELFCKHSSERPLTLAMEYLHTDGHENILAAIKIFQAARDKRGDEFLISCLRQALTQLSRCTDIYPQEALELLQLANAQPSLHRPILPIALPLLEKCLEDKNYPCIPALASLVSEHLAMADNKKSCIALLNRSRHLILIQNSKMPLAGHDKWDELIRSRILNLCNTPPLFKFYHEHYLGLITAEEPESEKLVSMLIPQMDTLLNTTMMSSLASLNWQHAQLQHLFTQLGHWSTPKFRLRAQLILKDAEGLGIYTNAPIPLRQACETATGELFGGQHSAEELMVKLCTKMITTLHEEELDPHTEDGVGTLVEQQFHSGIQTPELVRPLLDAWKSLLTAPCTPMAATARKAVFIRLFMEAVDSPHTELNPNIYIELVRGLHPTLSDLPEVTTNTLTPAILARLVRALFALEDDYENLETCTNLNVRDAHIIHLFVRNHAILADEDIVLDLINHYRRLAWLADDGGYVAQDVMMLATATANRSIYDKNHSRELYKFHIHMCTMLYFDTLSIEEKISVVGDVTDEAISLSNRFPQASARLCDRMMNFYCKAVQDGTFITHQRELLPILRRFFFAILPRAAQPKFLQKLQVDIGAFFMSATTHGLNQEPDTIPELAKLYSDCIARLSPTCTAKTLKNLAKTFQKDLESALRTVSQRTTSLLYQSSNLNQRI